MKSALSFILPLVLLASGSVFAAEYAIDKDHSAVNFSIRHMATQVRGKFNDFEGTFNFDPKKAEESSLKVSIKTASIDTGNKKRDDHLRGDDFFGTGKKENQTITFVSKKVSSTGDKTFKVEGDFTMHGKTQPVTLEVEYNGENKDPWGNQRAGFSAKTSKPLNRKEFGIVWNKMLDQGGLMLGEDVKVEIDVEAIQKAPAATAAPAATKKK